MEKTLTLSVEDALLSPMGFAIMSGAGLIRTKESGKKDVNVHMTTRAMIEEDEIDLTNALRANEKITSTAPIFVTITEDDGSLTGEIIDESKIKVDTTGKKLTGEFSTYKEKFAFVDYYVTRSTANTSEMQIGAENFAGNYYVECDTLFRRKADGKDLPATLTFPNVKIQSNFTFSMASTGDPSEQMRLAA